jgi:hypothetical protein
MRVVAAIGLGLFVVGAAFTWATDSVLIGALLMSTGVRRRRVTRGLASQRSRLQIVAPRQRTGRVAHANRRALNPAQPADAIPDAVEVPACPGRRG